jgi:hypothetical protein
MHIDGSWPSRIAPGPFQLDCIFESPRLKPGRYRIELKVKQNVRTNYYEPRIRASFSVAGPAVGSGGDVKSTWRTRCLSREADAIMGRG